jgi:hypothetical protein
MTGVSWCVMGSSERDVHTAEPKSSCSMILFPSALGVSHPNAYSILTLHFLSIVAPGLAEQRKWHPG